MPRRKSIWMRVVLPVLVIGVVFAVRHYSGGQPGPHGQSPGPGGEVAPRSESPRKTGPASLPTAEPRARETTGRAAATQVVAAFRAKKSGIVVEVEAEVKRVLRDDNDGSRHQRAVLRVGKDITVLLAHNIDLAPRVPLEVGDTVTVRGQYEWNERGGVLHWTHHDPQRRRPGGWIRHRGKLYR